MAVKSQQKYLDGWGILVDIFTKDKKMHHIKYSQLS